MNIKSIFCVVLILAFLMYYQTNPVFTIVIVVVGLGIYILYKSRASGSGSGLSKFLSGKAPQEDTRNIDDLVSLVMLQQLLTSTPDNKTYDHKRDHQKQDRKQTQKDSLESIQHEVLELFDEK
jgi:hypothetical protein